MPDNLKDNRDKMIDWYWKVLSMLVLEIEYLTTKQVKELINSVQ